MFRVSHDTIIRTDRTVRYGKFLSNDNINRVLLSTMISLVLCSTYLITLVFLVFVNSF